MYLIYIIILNNRNPYSTQVQDAPIYIGGGGGGGRGGRSNYPIFFFKILKRDQIFYLNRNPIYPINNKLTYSIDKKLPYSINNFNFTSSHLNKFSTIAAKVVCNNCKLANICLRDKFMNWKILSMYSGNPKGN